MNLITDPELLAKFADDVLDIIVTYNSHDGAESVSFIQEEMRCKGWKGLSDKIDFIETCVVAGFHERPVYKKNSDIVRTTLIAV